MGFLKDVDDMKKMSFKDKMKKSMEPTFKTKPAKKEAAQPTEQEKFHKKANIITTGIALWFSIPVFLFVAIIMVFVGFWVWDMIVGLFS